MNDLDDEDSASSGELVVRVRDVVPGGLELTFTIGDANGDSPEVSRATFVRVGDANHTVTEAMSSDTPFGLLACTRRPSHACAGRTSVIMSDLVARPC